MEQADSLTQRKRPGLGRLIATALAGGLGVFAIAADKPAATPAGAVAPAQGISSSEPVSL